MSEHTLELPIRAERPRRLGRLADPIRRHPLPAFFILTFAISWLPGALHLITGSGPVILGGGPAIAAILVLSLTRGKEGVRSLFRSMRTWRVGLRWWAVAILAPVLLSGIATGLNLALGAPGPSSEDLGRWTNVIPTALLILLVPAFGGAGEEPGWRGYALPGLLARRSPLVASLVLGVLWAFWHLPVYLVGDQHWSDLVEVVFATVFLTWLFRNALGSVLIAMVFHAMNNAVSGEYFSQWFSGNDSTRQSWMLVVVWSVAAAAIVLFARGFRATKAIEH